jgi:hypothetical protein
MLDFVHVSGARHENKQQTSRKEPAIIPKQMGVLGFGAVSSRESFRISAEVYRAPSRAGAPRDVADPTHIGRVRISRIWRGGAVATGQLVVVSI